jgi:large subunit ribosomal protein L13
MKTTYFPKKGQLKRDWYVIDLDGMTLGRAASAIAIVLNGKHKPDYIPYDDNGDFVIAINASKIKLTGSKSLQKMYYHSSGYPSGLKATTFVELMKKDPRRVIELAVKNMLPQNKLGSHLIKKLKVYRGADHRHSAQKPAPFPEYVFMGPRAKGTINK